MIDRRHADPARRSCATDATQWWHAYTSQRGQAPTATSAACSPPGAPTSTGSARRPACNTELASALTKGWLKGPTIWPQNAKYIASCTGTLAKWGYVSLTARMRVVIGGRVVRSTSGRRSSASLGADGHDARASLSRRARGGRASRGRARAAGWDDAAAQVDGADAVVNLAGVSIGGPRWTRDAQGGDSREPRRDDADARRRDRGRRAQAAAVFVTASGIDYYGDERRRRASTRSSPPGDSFLARVCVAWEAAAAEAPGAATSRCAPRSSSARARRRSG